MKTKGVLRGLFTSIVGVTVKIALVVVTECRVMSLQFSTTVGWTYSKSLNKWKRISEMSPNTA